MSSWSGARAGSGEVSVTPEPKEFFFVFPDRGDSGVAELLKQYHSAADLGSAVGYQLKIRNQRLVGWFEARIRPSGEPNIVRARVDIPCPPEFLERGEFSWQERRDISKIRKYASFFQDLSRNVAEVIPITNRDDLKKWLEE